jgi:FixJ family two-component response regulator
LNRQICVTGQNALEAKLMETRPLLSVVDDDESVRESLPDLLKEFGFAAGVSSAEEFLVSVP